MVELNNLIGELDLFQREIDQASQQQLNNNEPTEKQHLMAETCSITSYASINNNNTSEHKNSNTELNQLVNDTTDGLNLAAGYENPTFAHFEASPGAHDATSYISGSNSDAGSAVVVIYDHQIPITPDMDYAKQNSEIVMLRTKDPQQQSQLMPHETRELQQLSPNEYQLSDNDDDEADVDANKPNKNVNLATVKQRLSSFRATSDQQIQLLGLKQQQQQQQHDKGMITTTTTPTTSRISQKLLKVDSDRNSLPIKKGNILNERPRAAPKPTLSLTNLTPQQQMQQQQQIYAAMKNRINNKIMLKVDLDAKMRKQKERLMKQQQLQQQQQQQDTLSSTKTIPTTDALVVNSRYNHSMHINVSHAHYHHHHHLQQQQQDQYHNHIRLQMLTEQQQKQKQQHMNGHYQNSHFINHQNHLNQYQNNTTTIISTTTTTTTTTTSSTTTTPSNTNICKTSFAKLNCLSTKCVPVASPVVPTKTTTSTNVPKSAATTSKPCILPRPASLTGAFHSFYFVF